MSWRERSPVSGAMTSSTRTCLTSSLRALAATRRRTLTEVGFFLTAHSMVIYSHFSVAVTSVTCLVVHSIVFVRRLSSEACETPNKLLFRILLLLVMLIIILELFLKKTTTLLVCKELRIQKNALKTSHCHLPAKHECCVSQGSVKTLCR